MIFEDSRPGYVLSTDPARLDFQRIHDFLSRSYWAEEIPFALLEKSIRNSLPFGIYSTEGKVPLQVAFARVISDFATFAYLGDVYVEEEHRRRGLSKWLMQSVTSHHELQGLRRFCLGTRDAHGLYEQFGFKVIEKPENWMEIRVPDIYKKRIAELPIDECAGNCPPP